MTILIALVLLSFFFRFFEFFFFLRKVFNHHKRCSSTKLPGSTDQFSFGSTWPGDSSATEQRPLASPPMGWATFVCLPPPGGGNKLLFISSISDGVFQTDFSSPGTSVGHLPVAGQVQVWARGDRCLLDTLSCWPPAHILLFLLLLLLFLLLLPLVRVQTSFFNKRQRKRDNITTMRRRNFHFNWWLVRLLCLSSELDYQNVIGWGDTWYLHSNWHLKYKYFLQKEE